MNTLLQRLTQTAQRHRNLTTASAIPYATMHLNGCENNNRDDVALYVSADHHPDKNSPLFNTENKNLLVQQDGFGLQWRDKKNRLVRIGTRAEPLDEHVLEMASKQGVLVFFIDEAHLTPDQFAVFHAAQAI